MKINWKRILRTTIQAAVGALSGFVTMAVTDFSREGLLLAAVQFAGTVLSCFLMNLQKELGDQQPAEDDHGEGDD